MSQDYPFSTTFLPGPEKFDMSIFPLSELECAHGRLPGDPGLQCVCTQEPVPRKPDPPPLGLAPGKPLTLMRKTA